MALRAAESNEGAALGAMSHVSGSPTGSTETMSEAIGVLWNLPRTASSTERPLQAFSRNLVLGYFSPLISSTSPGKLAPPE